MSVEATGKTLETAPMDNSRRVTVVRHGASNYLNQGIIESSGHNAKAKIPYRDQVSDFADRGNEPALEAAHEYVETLDPAKYMVLVVSSKQARAVETASRYIKVLEAHGIQIVDGIPSQQKKYPVRIRSDGEEIDIDPRIVASQRISTNYQSWVEAMLNPQGAEIPRENLRPPDEVWTRLSEEEKKAYITDDEIKQYGEARGIVNERGTKNWGNNLAMLGGTPPFTASPTNAERRASLMRGLGHLMKLLDNEATQELERQTGKKIVVLVVDHEEFTRDLMVKHFDGESMPNLGAIDFEVSHGQTRDDFNIAARFNGKTAVLTDLQIRRTDRKSA